MLHFGLLKRFNRNLPGLIITPLFFIALYFYVLLRIEPMLYYQQQQPVFFFNQTFFQQFLSCPGGLTLYLSLLFSQYYFIPWAGALVVTAILLSICLLTGGVIKSVTGAKQIYFIHLLPVVFLLLLHQHYEHQLSFDLVILFSLLFFNLYYRLLPGKPLLRVPVFILMSIFLYYVAAASFFLFVILSLILELFVRRRYVNVFVYLVISILIPYAASICFTMMFTKNAYTYLLLPDLDYSIKSLPEICYLYFPVIMLIAVGYKFYIPVRTTEKIKKLFLKNRILLHALQIVILFFGGWYVAKETFDDSTKTYLQIQNYAQTEQWENVLNTVTPDMLNHKIVAFQFYRALFHIGKLADEMFSYPQLTGTDGLFLSQDIGGVAPLERSDLFFELGFVNESRHWAFEAVAIHGYTPWILKRLIEVHLLKGDKKFAAECLNKLDETLLFSDWSEYYKPFLKNDAAILKDARLQKISSVMSKSDFVVQADYPQLDMIALLKENKSNKMAFEYLMAYYLINRQLNRFAENFNFISNLNYMHIPRHYEEALIAYLSENKEADLSALKYRPNLNIASRFQELVKTLRSFNGDKSSARSSIKTKFGNTYWAYLLYK